MSDLSVQRAAPLAVTPAPRDAPRRERERHGQPGGQEDQQRETVDALLAERGVVAPEGAVPVMELITMDGEARIRIRASAAGAVLAEATLAELAAVAAAHSLTAGLLVERQS